MRHTVQELDTGVALTGSYQNFALDLSNRGHLAPGQRNVVTFYITGTSAAGDNITLRIQEQETFLNSSDVDQIGWVDKMEDSGTTAGALEVLERTVNLETETAAFAFTVSTNAKNVRIGLKGQGTVSIYASASKVS